MTDHNPLYVGVYEGVVAPNMFTPDAYRANLLALADGPYVVMPLAWVNEVNAFIYASRAGEMRPDHPGLLQAKADQNRDNAGERFPNLHQSPDTGEWYENVSGEQVVFTPHGYRRKTDVEQELGNGSVD